MWAGNCRPPTVVDVCYLLKQLDGCFQEGHRNSGINEDGLSRSAAAPLLNSMVPIVGSKVSSKFQPYILSLFGFIILTTFSPRQALMAEIYIVHIFALYILNSQSCIGQNGLE